MKYEVAVVDNEEDRRVLARNVPTEELWACVAAALEEPRRGPSARRPAALVSRMDNLPETWSDRVSLLVDVAVGQDKNGKDTVRRNVRYGSIDKWNKKKNAIVRAKMTMSDWDLLCKLNAWRPKPKGKVQRADGWVGSNCRNGDPMCACGMLDSLCRTQTRGRKVLASSMKGE